jgi:hypothetical protein
MFRFTTVAVGACPTPLLRGDFERKFPESLIDFIEIFLRDLVDFWPMQHCPLNSVEPFFFDAAILSRMRSPAISRSNWANDSSMLSVRRPMELVVLNCCVTDTNDALRASRTSTILAKSASRPRQPVDLVDNDDLNLAGLDVL